MAICNLIKPLDKNNTGKFIMFSQYTEDLTKNNAEGFKYHVVPSKFIAAYIQYALNDEAVDWNEHLSLILQNHFENGCAVCKNNKDIKWTPDMSANLFWNTMINQGIITTLKNKGDGTRVEWNSVKEFMYVNDINVQSYDVIDGMGYSEVYCYIPNDAKRIDYEISTVNANPRNIKSESNHLEGYPNKIVDNLRAINYSVDKTVEFQYENPKLGYKVNDNKEFDVNTIIVLYDINSVDDKGNVINLYKNIPMGIYLPGPFDERNQVSNTIKKYVSSEYAYGSGTSYGIRICSRFAAVSGTDFGDNVTVNIEGVNSEEYAAICQVMSGVADNLIAMKSIVKDAVFESSALKETLAIFKNSRTNVPYPVKVNEQDYWYINGRNTGIAIPDGRPVKPYTDREIQDILISLDGADNATKLTAFISDSNGNKIYYERLPGDSQSSNEEVMITWGVYGKYDNQHLNVNSLVIRDGELVVYPKTDYITVDSPANIGVVTKDTTYTLEATWNAIINGQKVEQKITSELDFKFYYPSFFGMIGGENKSNSFEGQELAKAVEIIKEGNWYRDGKITNDLLKGLKKYILPSASNNISFTSDGQHVAYIYPAIDKTNKFGYQKLTEIINLNDMGDVLHDFCQNPIGSNTPKELSKSPIEFDLYIDGTPIPYYLYYTTNSTSAGVQTEFKFVSNEYEKNNIEHKNK